MTQFKPELGIFMMPLHRPDRALNTVLKEDRDLFIEADRLGYAEAWMGEHYASTGEPVTSPLIFHASIIDAAPNMRLGTGVICLPQQHPVTVAGHVALLDHLSKGRVMFGIGSGGLSCDWEVFGLLDHERRNRAMQEAIEVIQKVWTQEPPWSHEGEMWQTGMVDRIDPKIGLGQFIKPYQDPHPPIAVSVRGANSATARYAGSKGWHLLSGNFVPSADVATHWPTYAAGAEEAGLIPDPRCWHVARSVLITESDAQAEEALSDPHGTFADYFFYLGVHGKIAMGQIKAGEYDEAEERADALKTAQQLVIAGSKETVAERLRAFMEETGPFGVLMLTAHDVSEYPDLWRETFRLMAEDIGPRLGFAVRP